MPKEYDNRNKKLSWREIDKLKEKKRDGGNSYDDENKKNQQKANAGAVKNYKSGLENIFSGGEVPEHIKKILPKGENEGQLKLLGAIKRSKDDKQLAKAMKAYIKKHDEFPEDLDLYLRVLEYPNEACQLKVAKGLNELMKIQPIDHKRQFLLKLDTISMLADDDDLRELAEELVDKLR